MLLSTRVRSRVVSFGSPSLGHGINELSAHNDSIFKPVYSPWVKGPPTQKFRDNLRDDYQYITSWLSAGWSAFILDHFSLIHRTLMFFPDNDVMTYMNLIYLGMITDRVPIVAMFVPMHIGSDADVIYFSEIFDVPRFIEDAGFPLLEWYQVKDVESETWDDLGCWNVWEAVQYGDPHPRHSVVPEYLRLGTSFKFSYRS